MNVKHAAVLDRLRANGVGGLESDPLYTATQALWVGSARDFAGSGLVQWFEVAAAVGEELETDVHLVRVDVRGDDRALHRDADPLARYDAFRRLPSNASSVTVSPRVPCDAYATDVYRR